MVGGVLRFQEGQEETGCGQPTHAFVNPGRSPLGRGISYLPLGKYSMLVADRVPMMTPPPPPTTKGFHNSWLPDCNKQKEGGIFKLSPFEKIETRYFQHSALVCHDQHTHFEQTFVCGFLSCWERESFVSFSVFYLGLYFWWMKRCVYVSSSWFKSFSPTFETSILGNGMEYSCASFTLLTLFILLEPLSSSFSLSGPDSFF